MKSVKELFWPGGSGTRLYPLTMAVSKQLMPVYDKPMVYYPISVLMLTGIKEILIISTPRDLPAFRELLGEGSRFGVCFVYAEQPSPDGLAQALTIAEDFLDGAPSSLILGDNIFYSNELEQILADADNRPMGATIFGYHVSDPSSLVWLNLIHQGKRFLWRKSRRYRNQTTRYQVCIFMMNRLSCPC